MQRVLVKHIVSEHLFSFVESVTYVLLHYIFLILRFQHTCSKSYYSVFVLSNHCKAVIAMYFVSYRVCCNLQKQLSDVSKLNLANAPKIVAIINQLIKCSVC